MNTLAQGLRESLDDRIGRTLFTPPANWSISDVLPAQRRNAQCGEIRCGTYTDLMLDRESCERRVYRLAVMLTGNPIAATKVISQVVDAQPDLSNLDSAHMDRLTVLRSREIHPASLVNPAIPQRMADAVAELSSQQREAWVLGRVYRTPLRELSRAMDCSSTAAERHLLQAEVNLRNATGLDPGQAAACFLKASLAIDVPEFHRRIRRRKRMIRRTLVLCAIAIVAVVLAVVVIRWTQPMMKSETTQGHSSLGHVMRI